MSAIDDAAAALRRGDLVVYPTETVYGLGADATDQSAVDRVFAAKGRNRSRPVSMAVPDREAAGAYVHLDGREIAFVDRFLPGPVTVVCAAREALPEGLAGPDGRVGIRIPDCEPALRLIEAAGTPITATSANRSGGPNVRRPADLPPTIRESAATVVDGGETPGGESTVVDVDRGVIHRAGRDAAAVRAWLADRSGD